MAIIRLHLRSTKTEKTTPNQVVEIPQTRGFLCPYKAYWAWIKARRGKGEKNKPLFTMSDGNMLTGATLNNIMRDISPKGSPKIMSRDFRAPCIYNPFY